MASEAPLDVFSEEGVMGLSGEKRREVIRLHKAGSTTEAIAEALGLSTARRGRRDMTNEQVVNSYPEAVACMDRVWSLYDSNLGAAIRGAQDAGLTGEEVYRFAHAVDAYYRSLPRREHTDAELFGTVAM